MPARLGLFFLAVVTYAAGATPVSLDDAFKASLAKNEGILLGKEQLGQAEDRVAQVRGGIFPNVSFNVFHQIQPEPADPVAKSFSPGQQTTVNFSVSQPLFRGLREFAGLSQLQHLRSAQEATQDQLVTRLYQEVAANYLQILSYEQDLRNLREQLDLYQKRASDLAGRAQRGESNQTDVISAQATHASLSAEIRLTEGQSEVARENFVFLTGLPRESALADPKIGDGKSLAPVETFLAQIEKRPDVQAARERLEAGQKGVSVAWGAHLPTLDAVGNYYLARPGFLSDLKWDVGLRLTVPLFEGLATQAKVSEAISKRREAELELARTRRAAIQEIRSLHDRAKARFDHLQHLQKSAELSQKNSLLMQRDYRRGLARNIDVQLALTEGRIAQRGYDQAYYSAQLETIQLQAAAALLPATATTPKENP